MFLYAALFISVAGFVFAMGGRMRRLPAARRDARIGEDGEQQTPLQDFTARPSETFPGGNGPIAGGVKPGHWHDRYATDQKQQGGQPRTVAQRCLGDRHQPDRRSRPIDVGTINHFGSTGCAAEGTSSDELIFVYSHRSR